MTSNPPSRDVSVGIEEGLEKVLEGGFSYIFNYYYIRPVIDTRYTDAKGYTPIYVSKTVYPLFSGNAWAFRRGAPFQHDISRAMQAILEGGLVTFWMDDVIRMYVRDEGEKETRTGSNAGQLVLNTGSGGEVVLGLTHLQGTFYALLLGQAAAVITHLVEHLSNCRTLYITD